MDPPGFTYSKVLESMKQIFEDADTDKSGRLDQDGEPRADAVVGGAWGWWYAPT